jgi:N-acetylmuramic acid 6-phosphate (MurNAc-6-P) etherase
VNLMVNLHNNSDSVRTRAMDLLDRVTEHGSQQAHEVLQSVAG